MADNLVKKPMGQKKSYIQPIIATALGIVLKMDILTWQKVLAAMMVFGGVIVVSRSRSASR